MENKKLLFLWVAIGLVVAGLVWVAVWGNKTTVIVNDKGQVVGAVSSALDVGRELGINGVQRIVVNSDFVDATTTIVSVINPFPATATVAFVGLFNTGVATTSYNINCGNRKAASAPRVLSNPTALYLQTVDVSTSSIFSQELRTPTTSPIYLASGEYFQCVSHGVSANDALKIDGGWDSAFTNPQNTFSGKFWVEFMGLIQ